MAASTPTVTAGSRRPAAARSALPAGANTLYLVLAPDGSVVTDPAGVELNAVVNDSAADDTLDATQIHEVSEAATSSSPTRVEVGGDVGAYLISTRIFADGTRVIVGVSTAPVEELPGTAARRRRSEAPRSVWCSWASAARC